MTRLATSSEAGVGKAPRHEIAWGVGTVGAAGLYGDLAAASGLGGVGLHRPPRSLCLEGWVWVTGGTSAAGVGGRGWRCDCGPIYPLAVSRGCAGREPAGMASDTGLADCW